MNKILQYIFKLIINAVLFLLVLFCLKYLLFKTFKGYYFKNLIPKKIENVDVGIFGHSQSEMGINENYLNNNSILNFENFSISGTPLYNTCSVIQHFINSNDKMSIVLEVGSNNLDEKGLMKNLFIEETKTLNFSFFYYILNDTDSYFLNNNVFKYLLFGSFNFPLLNFFGTQTDKSKINEAYDNFDTLLFETNKNWSHPQNVNFELERLELLIKNNPKTNFILIRIPEHKKNKDIFSNNKKFIDFSNKLKKYRNLTIKDYLDFNLQDDCFKDFIHLSSKGRQIFTEYFFKDNFTE